MSNKFISWLVFILLCFIWGSSFILMQYSKYDLTASQIASVRIFSAGLVFLPFAIFHIAKIPRNKLGLVLVAGIFGNLLPAYLFATAIVKIDSSLAGILNSLTPVCVVIIAALFFKDRIRSEKIVGVLVGFGGLLLLTFLPVLLNQKDISSANIGYSFLIVLATISYGANVNMVGHYLKGLKPVQIATVSLAFLTIPTAIVLWQDGFLKLDFANTDVRRAILASATLGIAGSAIATVLFYILVQKAGGLFASLVTYGIPFVALFWGFIFHERITWIRIVCLGIILIGVYLANRPDRSGDKSRESEAGKR